MISLTTRLKNAFNAFKERDPTEISKINYELGTSFGYNLSYSYSIRNYSKTILNVIFNRIAVDCSMLNVLHVILDEEEKYKSTVNDSLNNILNGSTNIDQTAVSFLEDAVFSMLENGHVVLVATNTSEDPMYTDSYDILDARVGRVIEWGPELVLVEAYNQRKGRKDTLTLEKRNTPIIQNPFYAIMNEPNSTLQRLKKTLEQLDRSNNANSNDKLDMIIQLPYSTRNPIKKGYARERREELESQIENSKLGIGYIDNMEKVIQLNRSLENNLWEQAKETTIELFNQIGLSKAVFEGTASEEEMLVYQNEAIKPIMENLVKEIERKWLSQTKRSQRHAVRYFKSPFDLVPVGQIAEMGDKMIRNTIMTSNEFRSILGLKPSDDPKADELINPNLNQSNEEIVEKTETKEKITEDLNSKS